MNESAAYKLLSDMADRARAKGLELPPEQAAQTHATGLGFNLLGHRFVAAMEEVNELMRVPQTTRVPGVKNFVMGVANVRGRLMTVLDLSLIFGQPSTLPRAQRRVLAVDDDEQLIGFAIDDSHGMQHFPSDTFVEEAEGVPELLAPYVRGAYVTAGVQWPLLSLKAVAEDPRLEKLALVGG